MCVSTTAVDFATYAPPSVDHDLRAALSLARASTTALLNLSALARREMTAALADEVAVLHALGDDPSLHAAEILTQYLSRPE